MTLKTWMKVPIAFAHTGNCVGRVRRSLVSQEFFPPALSLLYPQRANYSTNFHHREDFRENWWSDQVHFISNAESKLRSWNSET
jgi:hypothetical protein